MDGVEREIDEIISKLTLHEKIGFCHSLTKFSSGGAERLGIPPLTMSDGPHGVREEICAGTWDAVGGDDDYSTYLPTESALAATWSRECAGEFGKVLGSEARDRGKDVILGPGVNMIRTPLCGRSFEYMSEDPVLTGELAASEVRSIQSRGTAACLKHFALNSQELCRMTEDSRCDERTLREYYLPAFKTAIDKGGALTVMGAYNKFNGQYCCENSFLLNSVLKKDWGFSGLVVSDWGGVHDTLEAARGGLDIEMGSADVCNNFFNHLGDDFESAVRRGEVDMAVLDDKVRRILRVMFAVGVIGDRKNTRPSGSRNTAEHAAAARRIAEEAVVLLKNDGGILPLDRGKIRKLLLVGENCERIHHYGGHSSAVKTRHEVCPLEGIRKLLAGSGVEIEYFRGYPAADGAGEPLPSRLLSIADAGAGTRGWRCEVFDNHARTGDPVASYAVETVDFDPARDLPENLKGKDFGVKFSCTFTPEHDGEWTFYLRGGSQACLGCNGVNWIENCKSESDITSTVTVKLEAGKKYDFCIPYVWHTNVPVYPILLTAVCGGEKSSAGAGEDERRLLAAAASADAVVFFGGLNHTYDCEGTDRKDMRLHGGQNELLLKLAAVNERIVFVNVSGSPVEMPWIAGIPAVVQMWYAGQEGGHAIAGVLFGDVNPSGHLPVTFPVAYSDTPSGMNGDYSESCCNYSEGVLVGYRHYDYRGIAPLFPFGHGLSYTSFALSGASVSAAADGGAVCRVTVRNTGSRAGKAVVQLYAEWPDTPGIVRPVRELKDFDKIQLASGESREVEFTLPRSSLCYFHPVEKEWVLQPGCYRFRFGFSSGDLLDAVELNLN